MARVAGFWTSSQPPAWLDDAPMTRRRGGASAGDRRAYPIAPATLKVVLTKTWCGQLMRIMWTAYEPSLSFSTRLTVSPGYLASATALALLAAAPVMIVPVPGRQFLGI